LQGCNGCREIFAGELKQQKMHKSKVILLALVAFLQMSCVSTYEKILRSSDVDVKYKAAHKYFNDGKFKKAADLFDHLNLLVQGLPQEDTVAFYHGLSNFKYGDYSTAETILAKFIEVYPRSPFFVEAQYLRIKCLYDDTYRYELDQTPTRKAMSIISEFMYSNPQSEYYPVCKDMMADLMERLERKSFESAKLYYTMEDYKAARHALKNVLKDNADNQYRESVLYYTALASYKYAYNSIEEKQKERFLDFIDDYYNFISEYPESKYRKELDGLFGKVEHYAIKPESENKEEK
jgi:outer membrane protein assembly factor BamD